MEKQQLEDLINEGLSIRQIAAHSGKSYTSVRHWLKKFNLQTNATGRIPQRKCLRCRVREYVYSNKHCKECDRQRIVELGIRNKTRAVEFKGGKCEICGYSKCLDALEFHHDDPSKKDKNFNTMKYWSWDRIEKELEKCKLVCSNCHREIHSELRKLQVVTD